MTFKITIVISNVKNVPEKGDKICIQLYLYMLKYSKMLNVKYLTVKIGQL